MWEWKGQKKLRIQWHPFYIIIIHRIYFFFYWSLKEIPKGNFTTGIKVKGRSAFKKLDAKQTKFLNSMVGNKGREKVNNSDILLHSKIKGLSITFAVYLARLKDDWWSKITTKLIPIDQARKGGRWFMEWRGGITCRVETNWMKVAWGRDCWFEIIKILFS